MNRPRFLPFFVAFTFVAVSACSGDDASLVDVRLTTIDGRNTNLDEFVGAKPLVVSLWAVWCQPCRRELPELEAIHRDDDRVDVLAVNIGDDVAPIETFLGEIDVDVSVVRDVDGQLLEALGVPSVPATFIVDARGDVIWEKLGAVKPGEIATAIADLG